MDTKTLNLVREKHRQYRKLQDMLRVQIVPGTAVVKSMPNTFAMHVHVIMRDGHVGKQFLLLKDILHLEPRNAQKLFGLM